MDIISELKRENLEALMKELDGYTDYLPLILIPLAPKDYIQNATEEAHHQIFKVRNNQPGGLENRGYFKKDLVDWLNTHEEFKKYFEETL